MSDEGHWSAYNEAQLGRHPRPLCREVLAHAGPGNGRLAVDLGCGAGVETKAMLDSGWEVTAVDGEAALPSRLFGLVGEHPRLHVRVSSFNELEIPPADLVYAGYSLPFVPPQDFSALWERVCRALRPRAWLAVDLFGDRDDWAGQEGMTFLSRPGVEELLNGLQVVSLDEEDQAGRSYSGPKHWHVFHVIARRD